MPFNSSCTGKQNEIEFVKKLNGKRISELTVLFQIFLNDIFQNINYHSMVYSWINYKPQKTDIYIRINKTIKNVSIKKGVKNSVHMERITDFIHFLIENKVCKDVVIEYLKYHYADGTTNGKGNKRMSASQYKEVYQERIDFINKHINTQEILKKVVKRFVIQGNNSEFLVDVLLFGVIDDFIWIKAKDIEKIVLKKINVYSSGVHFGPLSCQPMDRCLNRNHLYENKRFCVQIKWYNLADDIIENMNDIVMEHRSI